MTGPDPAPDPFVPARGAGPRSRASRGPRPARGDAGGGTAPAIAEPPSAAAPAGNARRPSPPPPATGRIPARPRQDGLQAPARGTRPRGKAPRLGRLARGLALALLALPAAAPADEADLCLLAALDASRLSGVPLSVLLAVSLTETGRGDPARPWPWTVNMEGEGHWFPTREEALAFAEARRAAGATSFDLGCFQLNWRWHHENFVGADQMLDPLAGATYAAAFLARLHAESGDWSQAAAAYHSRTPGPAARYRAAFEAHLASARAAGADEGRLAGSFALAEAQVAAVPAAAGSGGAPRLNAFPLLQAGGAPRLGSLVPLDG